jgi:hypothetical protein
MILSSVLVLGLTALVGCGASSKASMSSVVPASHVTTTAHMTPPPPMPGETEFNFEDTKPVRPSSTDHAAISCKPNVQDKRGTIHAAY